jgi:hypothetical protein
MVINKINTTNSRLTGFSSWFMGLDKSNFEKIQQGNRDDDFAELNNPNYRPVNFRNTYLTLTDLYPLEYLDNIRNFTYGIVNDFEVELVFEGYYGEGDYVGWHTNADFGGYNALLTFSSNGNSGFKYLDADNSFVEVDVPDSVGWSIKKTCWNDDSKLLWHMAYSNCDRLTFTFNSPDEEKINSLITNLAS